ncbi:hypothetical protein MNBD_GAMMA23-1752 [hydrothermal vent metagenome]|uniref:Uncharacterized protein n=1 Tax=hydrothermal vent metagenome TaxID=652676 RepID=A0A3B0ZS36_9ZZZZ
MIIKISKLPLIAFLLYFGSFAFANPALNVSEDVFYKPFILAQVVKSADTAGITKKVEHALKKARFNIVGQYSPYPNTNIIVISSAKLRRYASQTENGIYAAVQRVTITTVDGSTQLSFTNPTYMAYAYRLKTDLADITQRLKKTLGYKKEFGSETGATKEALLRYQYRWMMMPNFTDRLELAEYGDQKTAINKVLQALKTNAAGVSKVYQIDLKGKNETIIGVQMKGLAETQCSGDEFVMKKIDFQQIKSTGHLPYEMVIQNGNVYALFAEFRIAMNFPDLSMMGKNSFMSIMCTPDAIIEALTLAAGSEVDNW